MILHSLNCSVKITKIPSSKNLTLPETLNFEPENLDEIKTSLRKEILSDLSKILAEYQTEMLKLIAPLSKKRLICTNDQDSDSEPENTSNARTSTPVKTTIATSSRTTPVNSRNTRSQILIFRKQIEVPQKEFPRKNIKRVSGMSPFPLVPRGPLGPLM